MVKEMIRQDSPYADMVRQSSSDFRVRTRIYSDLQIFEDEMRMIHGTTWVYVGHESEIPNPGDYKTGAVGRLPIIVSRSQDGQPHVLLNVCRHRGTTVCREGQGNTEFFKCPYHGWVYQNDGTLVGVTDRKGYPEEWGKDLGLGGLLKAPRMEVYRGLIFASFSEEGVSLEEYLGPVRKYVDIWLDKSPTGKIRVLPPHRSYYLANWKLQIENTTDGWHARYVHQSAFKTNVDLRMRERSAEEVSTYEQDFVGYTKGFPSGHGLLGRPRRRGGGRLSPEEEKKYKDLLIQRYGEERANTIARVWHITLFPNAHLMVNKIRVVQPVSVDKTIVYEYPVLLEGAPKSINYRALHMEDDGSIHSGFVNSDDTEILGMVQGGAGNASWLMEWLLLSRGMHREEIEASGERTGEDTNEVPQRSIYREWIRLMAASRNGGP